MSIEHLSICAFVHLCRVRLVNTIVGSTAVECISAVLIRSYICRLWLCVE